MVLMTNGKKKVYVPDLGVDAYRKRGFLIFGEDGVDNIPPKSAPPSVSEEVSDGYRCPHCGKLYAKEATLKRHIADKHKND